MKTIILKNVQAYDVKDLIPGTITESTAVCEEASDGYHTFDELYDHRIALFIALCRNLSLQKSIPMNDDTSDLPRYSVWRSKNHHVGGQPMYDGWFVMGIGHAVGTQISYHLPIKEWVNTEFANTLENAPEWDGHTPADVITRISYL